MKTALIGIVLGLLLLNTSVRSAENEQRPQGDAAALIPDSTAVEDSTDKQESINVANAITSIAESPSYYLSILEEAAAKNNSDAMFFLAKSYLLSLNGVTQNFTAAHDYFEKLIKFGNGTAYSYLAFMYSQGLGVAFDQSKALIYHSLAASAGEAASEMSLGYRYLIGIGTPHNCDNSAKFYHAAADKVASAFKRVGGRPLLLVRLLDEQDGSSLVLSKQDLLQYYQYTADRGDANAQFILGQLYQQGGQGVQQNKELAVSFLKRAVELGSAPAAALMGYLYLYGEGVITDYAVAMRYFRSAVKEDNSAGLNGMGLIYLNGYGVTKDHIQAATYFKKAADLGYSDAQVNLAVMMFNAQGGLKKDFTEILRLLTVASQQGHILGQYYLGVMHYHGVGTRKSCSLAGALFKGVAERGPWTYDLIETAYNAYYAGDLTRATMLYLHAADQGFEVAQSNFAFILDQDFFEFGSASESYQRALINWKRSGNQGHTLAKVKIGDYYYYGRGTSVDYALAAAYYQLADQELSPRAMFNLGFMHEHGIGLDKDFHLAKRFYDKAIATSSEAFLPATLALWQLSVKMTISPIWERSVGWIWKEEADWEAIAVTALVVVLGALVLTRNALARHNQPLPPRLD